ncbi:MAG TPA: hypothetical protein ENI51_02065 [Candidatus Atribacteria bacterium]|nr:hypothetical protein [Candidatus Atribacteria bacterium]
MFLELKIKNISTAEALMNPWAVNQATVAALNRAAKTMFTTGSKEIRKQYNIKAGDVKKAATIKKATRGNFEAALTIIGGPIPFKYFAPRQIKKGVTVKIKKGSKRTFIKSAFIGGYLPIRVRKMKTGKWIYRMVKAGSWLGQRVFRRKGKKRTPIVELKATGITISKLFQNRRIWPIIKEKTEKTFINQWWHSYHYYTNKK